MVESHEFELKAYPLIEWPYAWTLIVAGLPGNRTLQNFHPTAEFVKNDSKKELAPEPNILTNFGKYWTWLLHKHRLGEYASA